MVCDCLQYFDVERIGRDEDAVHPERHMAEQPACQPQALEIAVGEVFSNEARELIGDMG